MAYDSAPATARDSQTITPPATKAERLRLAANVFADKRKQTFKTIRAIENLRFGTLCATKTTGTALEPVVAALNAAGVPTDQNVGSVMKVLEIDRDDLHYVMCACHTGPDITGDVFKHRFNDVANRAT